LAAQRFDFRLRLERRCRLGAQLVQLEAQLGEPSVALIELAAQLIGGVIRFRLRLRLRLRLGRLFLACLDE
jgi:hypothetical protein